MINSMIIKKMIEEKGGVAKTSDFVMLGMNNSEVIKLVSNGVIERVKHGYYQLADMQQSNEANIISRLYPDGVLCLDTALFMYGYSDRTPLAWAITFDRNISRSRVKLDYPNIRPYYVESKYLKIGVVKIEVEGVLLNIYDKDKLICDCVKYRNKIEAEMFNKAIQSYIEDKEKNIKNFIQYAKEMRIYNKAKDLIGMWL